MNLHEWKRFSKKFIKTESCWIWTAGVEKGYGRFWLNGNKSAYRLSYIHFRGRIPSGLELDHLCRVRRCINPWHLEAVTDTVNILRGEGIGVKNGRKTHCKYGHEFTPENTYIRVVGGRDCRVCRRKWKANFDRRSRCA